MAVVLPLSASVTRRYIESVGRGGRDDVREEMHNGIENTGTQANCLHPALRLRKALQLHPVGSVWSQKGGRGGEWRSEVSQSVCPSLPSR